MNRKKKHDPWLIIIAGPNGAGKSTFYDLVLKDDPLLKNTEFLNLDNLAKEIADPGGDPNEYMLSAGKQIVDKINNKLEAKSSFIYETTASGRAHLKLMDSAKRNGYKVATVFIGLSNAILSQMRVNKRVIKGGHDVPPEDIARRYPKIIKNFPDMLAKSDVAAVFDNSTNESFKLILLMDDRTFRVFYKYPQWLKESINERKTRKEFIPMYDSDQLHRMGNSDIQEIVDNILSVNKNADKNAPRDDNGAETAMKMENKDERIDLSLGENTKENVSLKDNIIVPANLNKNNEGRR
jgi:predicted ABC-type ATPase